MDGAQQLAKFVPAGRIYVPSIGMLPSTTKGGALGLASVKPPII